MTTDNIHPELLEYSLGDNVQAFSSKRHGGASSGNYASFNITHYCGDHPESVSANRQLLCRQLGISNNFLFLPRQVHGDHTLCIDDEFLKLPDTQRAKQLEGVDAVITAIPGLCIGVSTADCIPVLLYDSEHRVAAAVHAGWRGTVSRIVEKTIREMQQRFGTQGNELRAIIGPGISLEAFEVGNEVYEAFAAAHFPMSTIARRFPTNGTEKWHIDLWVANYLQLEACGLPLSNIQVSGICTYAESHDFFSARRLGTNSGRIFSGILMK